LWAAAFFLFPFLLCFAAAALPCCCWCLLPILPSHGPGQSRLEHGLIDRKKRNSLFCSTQKE
jgi:hypothetical protein